MTIIIMGAGFPVQRPGQHQELVGPLPHLQNSKGAAAHAAAVQEGAVGEYAGQEAPADSRGGAGSTERRPYCRPSVVCNHLGVAHWVPQLHGHVRPSVLCLQEPLLATTVFSRLGPATLRGKPAHMLLIWSTLRKKCCSGIKSSQCQHVAYYLLALLKFYESQLPRKIGTRILYSLCLALVVSVTAQAGLGEFTSYSPSNSAAC
jgi:hypothetical protein